jgi:hypothetical protein
MIRHVDVRDAEIRQMIKEKLIVSGGNMRLKIYGRLDCKSGRRMKRENRVFFSSAAEAMQAGFRACGHCMKAEYLKHLLR